MEQNYTDQPASSEPKQLTIPKLRFYGEGGEFFGIWIVNILLTIITLGLYFPWARVATRKYVYQNTEFAGSRFSYTGTGNEMFVGFLKFIGIILVLNMLNYLLTSAGLQLVGLLVTYAVFAVLIPLAVFGSLRYRLSRTQWRGIHFAYVGSQKRLVSIYVKGFLLSIITLGIYSPWFIVDLVEEIYDNVRFGANMKVRFDGDGGTLLGKYLGGYILTILTLGIYAFWWQADLFNYFVDNTSVIQDKRKVRLQGTADASGMFSLLFLNLLIIVFSLGLASPWAQMRSIRFHLGWINFQEGIDVDAIVQSPETPASATSDFFIDLGDIMFG